MLQDVRPTIEQPVSLKRHDTDDHHPSAAEAAVLALADRGLDRRISLIGLDTLALLCVLPRRVGVAIADETVARLYGCLPSLAIEEAAGQPRLALATWAP